MESYYETIREVEFAEPDSESGVRDIVVKSKTTHYKDLEGTVDRVEILPTEVYQWDDKSYVIKE